MLILWEKHNSTLATKILVLGNRNVIQDKLPLQICYVVLLRNLAVYYIVTIRIRMLVDQNIVNKHCVFCTEFFRGARFSENP